MATRRKLVLIIAGAVLLVSGMSFGTYMNKSVKVHKYFKNQDIADAVYREHGKERVTLKKLDQTKDLELTGLTNTDLTELNYLSGLKYVAIVDSDVQTLVISSNTLRNLYAPDCGLEFLDLSECSALTLIDVSNNRLTTLLLPDTSYLDKDDMEFASLKISQNQLSEIDISNFLVKEERFEYENAGENFKIINNPSMEEKKEKPQEVTRNVLDEKNTLIASVKYVPGRRTGTLTGMSFCPNCAMPNQIEVKVDLGKTKKEKIVCSECGKKYSQKMVVPNY